MDDGCVLDTLSKAKPVCHAFHPAKSLAHGTCNLAFLFYLIGPIRLKYGTLILCRRNLESNLKKGGNHKSGFILTIVIVYYLCYILQMIAMQQCVWHVENYCLSILLPIFLLKTHKMLNSEYNLDLLKHCLDGRNVLCSMTPTHISTIYIWGYWMYYYFLS